jgi:hypothetical protein
LTGEAGQARLSPKAVKAAGMTEQAMQGSSFGGMLIPGLVAVAALASACTPTVRIEAGDKPITINLNVKIDQEIRYKIDKDLEEALAANPDIF